MNHFVKLDIFEGPLDLLLYLIKINEIDIFNIPIVTLTNQYIEYLDHMNHMDLSNISEFFQMAAQLTVIKSKMLLPPVANEETGEIEDPRTQLAEQLYEYKILKSAAAYLNNLPILNQDTFTHPLDDIWNHVKPDPSVSLVESDLELLTASFVRLMERFKKQKRTHKIVKQECSIEDRVLLIQQRLKSIVDLTFEHLVDECLNKFEMVITFLAILEMTKNKLIRIYQIERFQTIYIRENDGNPELDSLELTEEMA